MSPAQERLHVRLRSSRLLAAVLLAAYAGAAGCLAAIPLPALVRLPLLALLGLSAYCDLRIRAFAGSRSRLRALILTNAGESFAVDAAGRTLKGRPGIVRLVHPLAVGFSLLPRRGRPVAVLVLPDMTSAEEFRALRVWLRGQDENHVRPGLS